MHTRKNVRVSYCNCYLVAVWIGYIIAPDAVVTWPTLYNGEIQAFTCVVRSRDVYLSINVQTELSEDSFFGRDLSQNAGTQIRLGNSSKFSK